MLLSHQWYRKCCHTTFYSILLSLVACVPIRSQPSVAPTSPPAAVPTATTDTSPSRITFDTSDGARLTGGVFGAGTTAIILSNMGDNDPTAWEKFAPLLASQGYLVLTYKFRYPTKTSTFTSQMANQTVDDLQGVIAYARAQGASEIVLIGASLGGMTTAKVAATEHLLAMIILGSPADLSEFEFKVEASELRAITAPKLIIASEGDKIVPFSATKQLFELAADPKELQSYPGSAHGVQLFTSVHGDDLTQRLLDFIKTHASVENQ